MDEVIDQLKHLRTVYLTILFVSFTAVYFAVLNISPAPTALEIKQLSSYADSANRHALTFFIGHQRPWFTLHMDSVMEELAIRLDSLRRVETKLETSPDPGALWGLVQLQAVAQLHRADLRLQDLRTELVDRPLLIRYVSRLESCTTVDSFKQYRRIEGVLGRVFSVSHATVQNWPGEDDPSVVSFRILDMRYMARTSRESFQADPPLVDTLSVQCSFTSHTDTLPGLMSAAWFESRFPHLTETWATLAGRSVDDALARVKSKDLSSRGDVEVELLGLQIKSRFVGYAVPVILWLLLVYITTSIYGVCNYLQSLIERKVVVDRVLMPWLCTYTNQISKVVSAVSLVLIPAVSAALLTRSLSYVGMNGVATGLTLLVLASTGGTTWLLCQRCGALIDRAASAHTESAGLSESEHRRREITPT